ncbi:MAG: phosphopantothenoylcysteine decarboxylase, partial [Acidimicrobiales bacterium]
YALAEAALARGAHVTLISTVDLEFSAGINLVRVESAQQMSEAVFQRVDADVIVMAAAVADFRPADVSNRKIKKDAGPPQIVLEQTQDILSALGAAKRPDQVIVGFAAETEELISHAQEKLQRKNVDIIVANDVSAPEVGFGHETNEVTILEAGGKQKHVTLRSKRQIADEVLDAVTQMLVK